MTRPHQPLSRRSFLQRLTSGAALGLLAGCRAPAFARKHVGPRPFRFIVLNDLHFADPACEPFFSALVRQLRAHGELAFCLACGDLVDRGSPDGLRSVQHLFATLGIPFYPVPGNHDCDLEQDTRLYASVFPDRVNYAFSHSGWQFIGFDSTEGNAWQNTRIGAEALAFLQSSVDTQLDRTAPTVVFTHFPLAAAVPMAPLNVADALIPLETLNLRATFGGHFHGRTEHVRRGVPLITNACCSRVRNNHDGSLAEGYLVCSASPDGRLTSEFFEYAPGRAEKVPEKIALIT